MQRKYVRHCRHHIKFFSCWNFFVSKTTSRHWFCHCIVVLVAFVKFWYFCNYSFSGRLSLPFELQIINEFQIFPFVNYERIVYTHLFIIFKTIIWHENFGIKSKVCINTAEIQLLPENLHLQNLHFLNSVCQY